MNGFADEAASVSARRASSARQDDQRSAKLLASLRSCLGETLPDFAAAARSNKLRTNWRRLLRRDGWLIFLTIPSSYSRGEIGVWVSWNGDWDLPYSSQYSDSEVPYMYRAGFENYMVLEHSEHGEIDVADLRRQLIGYFEGHAPYGWYVSRF